MKNADMPAMPIIDDKVSTHDTEIFHGLTKREQVLKDFMAAIISNPNSLTSEKLVARVAAKYTDAYFKELEK